MSAGQVLGVDAAPPGMGDVILVLGAGGQLGARVAARASALGYTTVAATRAKIDIAADTAAAKEAISSCHPDVIVNAAAYTNVDGAENDRAAATAINHHAPAAIAEVAAEIGAAIIHVSTDYVFNGSGRRPYLETDPTGPLNVYGATKLAGEKAVRDRIERHAILRTSWVYSATPGNFVTAMLKLIDRPELRVVADQHGCPTSADDLAGAVVRLIPQLGPDAPSSAFGTFHAAGQGVTTWHGLASEIFAIRSDRSPDQYR